MRKLFLSHFTGSDAEVTELAYELGLYGVPIWVDHHSGFAAGDNFQDEARRVVLDPNESFGLALYATPKAFTRDFIKRIEIKSALIRKDRDPGYILMAIPRNMSFKKLSALSVEYFGEDLSAFKTFPVASKSGNPDGGSLRERQFRNIAEEMLDKWFHIALDGQSPDSPIGINLCTRACIAPSDDDILDVDATWLLSSSDRQPEEWGRLLRALTGIQRRLRKIRAVPSLRVRGSKHLTTALMFGWVFAPPTVKEISVQQGDQLWSTRCDPLKRDPFVCDVVDGNVGSKQLYVEVTATDQDTSNGVRALVSENKMPPHARLRFRPDDWPVRGVVKDNPTACAMALQVRQKVLEVCHTHDVNEIHLFLAVPQGLALLIGHFLRSTLPLHMYEFSGGHYRASAVLDEATLC